MMRSSSPITNHDGSSRHGGHSPDGATSASCVAFRVVPVTSVEAEMELPFAGIHQLCAPVLDQLDALPTAAFETADCRTT
jgi:hypothetical protein